MLQRHRHFAIMNVPDTQKIHYLIGNLMGFYLAELHRFPVCSCKWRVGLWRPAQEISQGVQGREMFVLEIQVLRASEPPEAILKVSEVAAKREQSVHVVAVPAL